MMKGEVFERDLGIETLPSEVVLPPVRATSAADLALDATKARLDP